MIAWLNLEVPDSEASKFGAGGGLAINPAPDLPRNKRVPFQISTFLC